MLMSECFTPPPRLIFWTKQTSTKPTISRCHCEAAWMRVKLLEKPLNQPWQSHTYYSIRHLPSIPKNLPNQKTKREGRAKHSDIKLNTFSTRLPPECFAPTDLLFLLNLGKPKYIDRETRFFQQYPRFKANSLPRNRVFSKNPVS